MATSIMPVSDLRRKTSEVLDDLRDEKWEVHVTRCGHPVAVLVDYEYDERVKERSEQSQWVSPTEFEEGRTHPRQGAQYPTVASLPSSLKNWLDLIPEGDESHAVAGSEAFYDEV